ncbi:hypothetical protein PEC730217_02890 [Pectobacterium carotovorum subsp. carotovorum]|nr:hypothetical protein PEC730217_02890 [Pectobacterium carotovorum subsp. carotovorum]
MIKLIKRNGLQFQSFILLLLSFLIKILFNMAIIANVMAVLSIVILVVQILINDKRLFYLTLFPIYGLLGQLISLIVIEYGWVLIELGNVRSYSSYSLLFLALTSYLFINIIYFISKACIFKNTNERTVLLFAKNKILYYFPVVYLIVIYFPVFIYGPAFIATGGDRVAYLNLIPEIFDYIFKIKQFILPIAGVYYFLNKRFFFLYLFFIIIWNLLIGEKATGLMQSLYAIFIPYVLLNHEKIKIRNILISLFFIISFIVVSIILNYIFIQKAGAFFILDRISMQGQLWWYYFDQYISNSNPHHNILDEFTSEYNGLQILMQYSMPSGLFNFYVDNGIGLTSGFPSIYLFYFGYFWLIPALLVSLLFGIPVYMITYSFYKGNIFSFLISNKIFFSLLVLLGRGDISNFLDYKLLIYIFVFIILQFMPRLKL